MSSDQPKKRLKAAESRRALLDAGLELLQTRGVAPGLDRVTLKEAIELSGVPRSTAYRLYEGNKGQLEEFRADLLADLDSTVDGSATQQALERVLDEVAPLIESNDPIQMAQALREVVRTTINANMDSVVNSLEWRVHVSSLASLGTGAEADSALNETFRVAAQEFGDRFVAFYRLITPVFGIRAREPFTIAELGALASAVAEGVALRQHIEPRLASMKRATGPNGELQVWNAAGIAIEGLMLTFIEANPDADVSADMSSWTSWS